MARRLTIDMFRVLVGHWPQLIGLFLIGSAVQMGFLWFTSWVSRFSGTAAIFILPLAPLSTLTALVFMLRVTADSLPAFRDAFADVTRAMRVRQDFLVLVAIMLPFLTVYASQGLLDIDRQIFIVDALVETNLENPVALNTRLDYDSSWVLVGLVRGAGPAPSTGDHRTGQPHASVRRRRDVPGGVLDDVSGQQFFHPVRPAHGLAERDHLRDGPRRGVVEVPGTQRPHPSAPTSSGSPGLSVGSSLSGNGDRHTTGPQTHRGDSLLIPWSALTLRDTDGVPSHKLEGPDTTQTEKTDHPVVGAVVASGRAGGPQGPLPRIGAHAPIQQVLTPTPTRIATNRRILADLALRLGQTTCRIGETARTHRLEYE